MEKAINSKVVTYFVWYYTFKNFTNNTCYRYRSVIRDITMNNIWRFKSLVVKNFVNF